MRAEKNVLKISLILSMRAALNGSRNTVNFVCPFVRMKLGMILFIPRPAGCPCYALSVESF